MNAVDLFAGAGGFTQGAEAAGVHVLWAANHFRPAVDIHALNHPEARPVCQDLHQADWREMPRHDLLLASPSCKGHADARGKDKPHHDAQRNTAWAVVSALECHRTPLAIVENVEEFQDWLLYPAWAAAMGALGYSLAPHLVDAADHGVPQNRVRLFLVCTRSRSPLQLELPRRAHTAALSILESLPASTAIRSLCPATRARIKRGRAQHGDRFLVSYYKSTSGGRSLTRPLGTVTTKARWALVEGNRLRMLTVPEYRRAMGFPETYQLPGNKAEAIQMLGNAVCPPVATDLILAIKSAA